MPEQPPDPRHYQMKIPPEPEYATLKRRESENGASGTNESATETTKRSNVVGIDEAKPKGGKKQQER